MNKFCQISQASIYDYIGQANDFAAFGIAFRFNVDIRKWFPMVYHLKYWDYCQQVWEMIEVNGDSCLAPITDKLDEIPWDEIAEKAKATGVSMKQAAMDMGVSLKEKVEDRMGEVP